MTAKWRKARSASESAFTLVELIVTIAIIGVLASIAVVSLQKNGQVARISACKVDWRAIRFASDAFYNTQNGTHPRSIVDSTNADGTYKYVGLYPHFLADPGARIRKSLVGTTSSAADSQGYVADVNTKSYKIKVNGLGGIVVWKFSSPSSWQQISDTGITACNQVP